KRAKEEKAKGARVIPSPAVHFLSSFSLFFLLCVSLPLWFKLFLAGLGDGGLAVGGLALSAPAAPLAEDLEQVGAQVEVADAAAVPLAQDVRRAGVEAGDVVQPGDAGVEGQVAGARVVPGGVRRQAAHRHRPREAAVDQERTALLQQLDEPVEAGFGQVGQPRRLQLTNAVLGKHGPLLCATGRSEG